MRVILLIKGDPEPGAVPSEELLGAMGRYNDELKEGGVLIDVAGLLPSAEGRRVKFSGGNRASSTGRSPGRSSCSRATGSSRCSRWTRLSNGPSVFRSRRGLGSTRARYGGEPRSRSVRCSSRGVRNGPGTVGGCRCVRYANALSQAGGARARRKRVEGKGLSLACRPERHRPGPR
jgi:hypothetical protein